MNERGGEVPLSNGKDGVPNAEGGEIFTCFKESKRFLAGTAVAQSELSSCLDSTGNIG